MNEEQKIKVFEWIDRFADNYPDLIVDPSEIICALLKYKIVSDVEQADYYVEEWFKLDF